MLIDCKKMKFDDLKGGVAFWYEGVLYLALDNSVDKAIRLRDGHPVNGFNGLEVEVANVKIVNGE